MKITSDMKRILTIATLALTLSNVEAQTSTSTYQPGITQDGATYFLPKTAIHIAVKIEKTVYTPGDFAPYAERFLRLTDVSTEPSTTYRIVFQLFP